MLKDVRMPQNSDRMRATPISLLLLVAALMVAACGPTTVLAGGPTRHASRTEEPRTGGRSGAQALGETIAVPPRRILFVGASLTEGWYASTKDRTYTTLVANGIAGGRRIQVRTLAHPGATAEDVAHWDLRIQTDYVVLQVATNDFVKDVPVDVYAASYADVLEQLRAASPKADLVCLGAWLDPTAVNRLGVAAVDYDVATRTACGEEGGRYVDLSATYLDPLNHGPMGRQTYHGPGDLYHPNDRGHAQIADLVLASDGALETARPVA
jgi:acyl-CoA thioesterase I